MSSGYPHLTVTAERRHLAYECVLLYEVVTKRLAALDDIRQGFTSVSALGTTCLDLLDTIMLCKRFLLTVKQ